MLLRATAAGLAAGLTLFSPAATAHASTPPPPTTPAPATGAGAPSFSLDWTHRITTGHSVSTSSPVLVDNGGDPFVVAAETEGQLRAYDLDTGTAKPGWSATTTGYPVTRAPLSSDGTNVYLPVAQAGHTAYPQYRKYAPGGTLSWNSNPSVNLATAPFMLSGISLANIGGTWQGFSGSSSMQVHSLNAATGAQNWAFFNADSTMATPAVADLYGIGTPQVVFSSDTTNSGLPGDRNGGILRILTADGKQVCSDIQFVDGDTYKYSGYNNSTPAVARVDGRTVIAFGSTGPAQSGPGANQVLGYDSGCRRLWASPPLAGRVDTAISFADLTGGGRPSVLVVVGIPDGSDTYPRVYALDAATGAVQRDSGTSLRSYGAMLAFTTSSSVTTADVDNDGGQDLFVPSREGAYVVLDGSTFAPITTIPTNMATQNTPIITATPTGLRFTVAGYNGLGSQISSYTMTGGSLGQRGWHHFGANPQLTNTLGDPAGPDRDLLEGQSLTSGRQLRAGAATFAMQPDGNAVARNAAGAPVWATGTSTAGSRLYLALDGELQVRSPTDTVLWRSNSGLGGVERLVLDGAGVLRVTSAYWGPGRQLAAYTTVWSSTTGPATLDGLWFGQTLPPGRSLFSADREYELLMQRDGNLVLYRRRFGQVVWASNTSHPSGRAELAFGQFGELVLRVPGGPVLRDFGTGQKGADRFSVRADGSLAVTSPFGATLWDTRPATPPPAPRVK